VNWPWNGIRGGFFHHPIIIIVVIESSVKCNLWILRTLANRLPTGFQYASIKPTKNYNKEEKSPKRKRMLQISFTNSPWRPRFLCVLDTSYEPSQSGSATLRMLNHGPKARGQLWRTRSASELFLAPQITKPFGGLSCGCESDFVFIHRFTIPMTHF